MPGPGVVVERSYIPSQPYEIAKNGEKTGGFAHVLAYKSPKTPFFALKYLTRYTHETFFKEYTNFEGHYLSRCRDIPFQSFGSHIRSQPHGLGLKVEFFRSEKITIMLRSLGSCHFVQIFKIPLLRIPKANQSVSIFLGSGYFCLFPSGRLGLIIPLQGLQVWNPNMKQTHTRTDPY